MSIQKCSDILVWGAECVTCFRCKCRTFRDWDFLAWWLLNREFKVRSTWRRILIRNKNKITIYWCEKMPGRFVCSAPDVKSRTEDRCWYHEEVDV